MRALCSALLALCWAFSAGESRESLPMRNLSCYNDYTSHISCTWQESKAARHFLQLSLHHKDNLKNESTKIPCEPQGAEGLPVGQDANQWWSCCMNHTAFGIGVKDKYSFKPDRLLQAKLNVSLFQNVQPLTPQKLQVNVTEAGDFLLAWEAAGGRNGSRWLQNALEFEVAYKREWERWENSSSVSVTNASHFLLRRDVLVPGSTYVARVRSKPSRSGGWSGQSSEWSTSASWRSQEGDEAQPKNLRCLFNGVDRLKCSWEVRREVSSSVLFTLFYTATSLSEEAECFPVREEDVPGRLYLFQSCEINVTNPSSLSQYLINVRPKEEEKLIEAYKNIKPLPPVNISVTKVKDQEYKLRWTKQTLSYEYIGQRYEFMYWKTDDDSLENAQFISISNDAPPFIFTLNMLEPSTCYTGKMRARVEVHSLAYNGPWSEWSEECTWETESVRSPLILPLLVSVFTIMLVAFGCWCYTVLLRKKKKWEEKIPNPGKSQLVQSYLQKTPLGILLPSSQLDFSKQSLSEKTDLASCVQVLDGPTKVGSAELPEAMAERMMCFSSALDPQNPYQTLEATAPAPRPSDPAGCHPSQASSQSSQLATQGSRAKVAASQAPLSCFDFNGPYLHLPHRLSLPEVPQLGKAAPMDTKGRLLSLEYVSLPQDAHSQTLPVEEERKAAQLCPVSLPTREEMKQTPAGGPEMPHGPSAGGQVAHRDTDGQRSPPAATLNNPCQKWPMGYVTTEGLSQMSASNSAHPCPVLALPEGAVSAAGVVMSSPCPPHATQHTPSPEKPGDIVPVPSPASATPSEASSYILFPKGLHGAPEPTGVSSPILLEGVDFGKAESMQEGNVVMFNADGTEPVFLRQVGEYCFFPGLRPEEKTPVGEKGPLADQASDANEAFGKPPGDGRSVNGKQEPAVQMQAIQLFKALKCDDYFALPL